MITVLSERLKGNDMKVETDITTKQHTLAFEKRRIKLDKAESREFERWLEQRRARLNEGR